MKSGEAIGLFDMVSVQSPSKEGRLLLSTVELDDRILMLDAWRLGEQGSTRQLLQHIGLFAKRYRSQNSGFDQTQETE